MLQISVKDTGIGIAKENQEKIFTEFYQVDSSYSKKYKGTGLGLPLTKKLVELHGGTIWIESELEKGCTFSFTIPQRLEGGKQTILVVEDEKQARELIYTIKDLSREEKKLLKEHVISIMQKGQYSKEDILNDIKKVMRLKQKREEMK